MLVVTTNSEQNRPHVVYGVGKYFVTWDDYSNGTNWDIYGQFVLASGTLIGGNFLICAPANGRDEKGASTAFDGTNFHLRCL